jgi:cytochrome c biogenesis protein CcdA
VARLEIVKGLYPNSVFTVDDIAEPLNINRYSEIQKIINVSYLPFPVIGMFSNGELKIITGGGLSKEAWGRIVLNNNSGVNVYIDNGAGEAVLERNIGDSQNITRLEDLFMNKDISQMTNGTGVPLSLLLTTALMDSLNPCMLGFFLIFLSFMSFSGSLRIAFRTSLAFEIGVFIIRYIMGIGLMQIFYFAPAIKIIAVVLALLIGGSKTLQFFFGEKRQIPSYFAEQITKHIENVTSPRAGFIAGCLTAFFIIPCSSPPYFLALGLLATSSSIIGGLGLLAVYDLAVITPLFLVSVCVYSLDLTTTLNLRNWLSTRRRYINLVIGLWLIAMSIFLIFYQV